MKRAFTLIELLVVMAIMGLLGTAAVGGYRAMQRGMEERSVMSSVNQFIRAAYQRAQIDRSATYVYYWNECIQEETDEKPLIVAGKAVAVRRQGRFSRIGGGLLYDEFGDLRYSRLEDGDGNEITSGSSSSESNIRIYQLGDSGNKLRMSLVLPYTQSTEDVTETLLDDTGSDAKFRMYAFEIVEQGDASWKCGSEYGTEFQTLQLPHGYIFGSSYSTSISSPVNGENSMKFKPGVNTGNGTSGGIDGGGTVAIYSLRPGKSGSLEAQKVDTSDRPDSNN